MDDDDAMMLAALEAVEAGLPARAAAAAPASAAVPAAVPPPAPAPAAMPAAVRVPAPAARRAAWKTASISGDLDETLRSNFGFDEYRPGQRAIIEAALRGRDTAVFWSTGSGKSLCYQIPALHRFQAGGGFTVVCSPLISLMQDQVLKLNATAGEGRRQLATFLGSAQTDGSAERRALAGEFALVYVSPEKLVGDFLYGLVKMQEDGGAKRKVGLFAVDESHCISEWGNGFRAEFLRLGELREALPDVPTMALTATAVPRVREDVKKRLRLADDALIDISSFDRPNLELEVHGREVGRLDAPAHVAAILGELASKLSAESVADEEKGGGGAPKSTIVYCSTRRDVDSVFDFLRATCSDGCKRWVERYHAGLSTGERRRVHTGFVSNAGAAVVVATVAFGMGIDKPDIRRVVHYGPPKSVEEYYQQVGRAGRDGLKSQCVMHANDGDFGKYNSPFYTESLQGDALKAHQTSLAALRNFAREAVRCRRKLLLEYLGEADPPFGNRCGTCDTCRLCDDDGEAVTHDYGPEARVVLETVATLPGVGKTKLLKLMCGSAGSPAGAVALRRARMIAIRAGQTGASRAAPTVKLYEAILAQLLQTNYVSQESKTNDYGAYDTYSLTKIGIDALAAVSPRAPASLREPAITLPLSSAMLELRAKFEAKKAALLVTLVDLKIGPETVPTAALESGEVSHLAIRPIVQLAQKLKRWRSIGNEMHAEKADALEALHASVRIWRAQAAAAMHVAPSTVLSDAVVASIVYTEVDDVEALRRAGVRVAGVEELAAVVSEWKSKHRSTVQATPLGSADPDAAPMVLPTAQWVPARSFQPPQAYKTRKSTAKNPDPRPTWEVSAEAVAAGQSIQSIALNQPSGRPIQVNTVFKHCLTALEFRRPARGLSLRVLADFSPPPCAAEWRRLEDAAGIVAVDFLRWEIPSPRKEFCALELGEEVNADYQAKSASQLGAEQVWYRKIDWFITLKRVQFEVRFGHDEAASAPDNAERDTKRQKLST